MKKFQFLLLDAGPIIELFRQGIWDEFVQRCDITLAQTVVEEAKWASQKFEDVRIELEPDETEGAIRVFDLELSKFDSFLKTFGQQLKQIDIHSGEKETLAFLYDSTENWRVCAADKAVFRFLGMTGKGESGISLEEILKKIGLVKQLDWEFTKRFRKKFTRIGQVNGIQNLK